ncbi:teneurin-m-like [Watersipora subatra]|uniref:teneurin-m-like n=1 Tax=Watersipora subatra TaxID=2589382 RepID=UPI00355BBE66
MCTHNSRPTNALGSMQNHQSPYRASNSLVSRSMTNHDRLALQDGNVTQQRGNHGSNTMATTGSHSYETPWDNGDRFLSDSFCICYRHIPPPSSPPPPPPESMRRPTVPYESAVTQSNVVHHLPQKKTDRRQCNWRCIGVFLMLAIVLLAGCVAAFTYLLVEKQNSNTPSKGASLVSGPVTDGNLGDRHRSDIPPYDFVKVRFYMAKSKFYKFNVSISSDSVIGVYGRRSVEPTHIQYTFVEALYGQQIAAANRPRRSTQENGQSGSKEVNSAFVEYLETGYWYISFYNDGNITQSVRFTVTRHDKMSTNCPNDCYGKGDCDDGVCRCFHGYEGVECNLNACPVLCSGNGVYEEGSCKCFDSWKGVECSIQAHHCEECVHGRCLEGQCSCAEGWRGTRCEEVNCPVSDCSGHGICHAGNCYCETGYRGLHCSVDELKNFTIACSNDCSGHGSFEPQLQTCTCQAGWRGRNCEQKECNVECINGHCFNGHCVCDYMWEGVTCTQKKCDARCALHGVCRNGTCNCQPGWNGKHCTMNGCPSDCNSHGSCEKTGGIYSCSCEAGWKGFACGVAAELQCDDGTDNDGDHMTDCFDPDCCKKPVCSDSPFCGLAPEPIQVLQSSPSLSALSSFYDRNKFLVQPSGTLDRVQNVADLSVFDPARVSVIRGKVLLRDGSPALCTRVYLPKELSFGFTLTRENGEFDLMVNGGGSINLWFVRGQAPSINTTVWVAWNTFVTIDPVTLLQENDEPINEQSCSPDHDRYTLYPVVLPMWQHTQLKTCPEQSAIIPESQVVQESITIPGTDAHIIYKTSDMKGYKSTILIQLTPKVIPSKLFLVHLKIVVEGVVHTEIFEADPNLTYKYSWNKQNAYQQNIYGIRPAQVSVGYQYVGCDKIIWDKQATTISGYHGGDVGESARYLAKGWRLDIQHFYNYMEGILQKGDGSTLFLKEQPELLKTVLGNGSRNVRPCEGCEDEPTMSRLMAPLAIASDLDGAVYVADYDLIRRLSPDMTEVRTVLELSFDWYNGCLVAGIAVSSIGEIYFVDDSTIRKIDINGVIDTYLGRQDQTGQYLPMPCGRAADLYEVHLGWPTSIAFSPIDESLHILDKTTNLILKMTPEKKVTIVAGRPAHCPQGTDRKAGLGLLGDNYLQSLQARNNDLVALTDLTFDSNGKLYVIESDQSTVNRVRVISTDGYISHFAGVKPKCSCEVVDCQCWNPDESTASKALFSSPVSLTVTPNGVLYMTDFGNLRVHAVVSSLPSLSRNRHYEVVSDGQLHTFNNNGFHIQTADIMTNTILYNFTMYPPSGIAGNLQTVTARGGNVLRFNRDRNGQLVSFTLNQRVVGNTSTNNNGEFQKFTDPNGLSTDYNYESYSGLMTSKVTSKGELFLYEYDDTGRVTTVILPTGETNHLDSSAYEDGAMVTLSQNGAVAGAAIYNGNSLSLLHGKMSTDLTYSKDGSIVVEYPSGLVVTLETGTTSTARGQNSGTALKRKVIASAEGPVHRLEWKYYMRRQEPLVASRKRKVGDAADLYNEKQLMVNGENLLTLEYLEGGQMEIVKKRDDSVVMQIIYSVTGAPEFLAGNVNTVGLASVNLTYDAAGHLVAWKQDQYFESREYSSVGQLTSIRLSNLLTTHYSYEGLSSQPTEVRLPQGVIYKIKYDSLGNLMEVMNPEGQRHILAKSLNMGFIRQTYQVAGTVYMEDYSATGHLLRQIYPTEQRSVHRRYTVDDRPSEVLYDSNCISYHYEPQSQFLSNISLSTTGYNCDLHFQANGSLCDEHSVTLTSKNTHIQFAETRYKYKYNKFLRVTKISGLLKDGSHAIRFENIYNYSSTSGLLSQVQDLTFGFDYSSRTPKLFFYNSAIYVERLYDKANLLRTVRVSSSVSRPSVKHEITYGYDALRRITSFNSTSFGGPSYALRYSYESGYDITQVRVVGGEKYKYTYNSQGSITEIRTDSQSQGVALDSQERVLSYNGHTYSYDQDGFLVAKDNIRFEFNSLGQITHVLENGKIDVSYVYDSIGRLVTRKDNYGSTLQLMYANVMNPTQLTNVYNFSDRTLYRLLYNDLGHIIAVDNVVNGERVYIVSDNSGTPIAVYSSDLDLQKSVHYTVFGEVVTDTNPSLQLFLGFQGGFYDPATQLLLLSERWYFPELGRWMDRQLPVIFDIVDSLFDNPTLLNGYKLHSPINTHLKDKEAMYMADVNSWLKVLGYDFDVLAPRMTFEGKHQVSAPERKSSIKMSLLPLISAFQCAFEKDMDNFLKLSLVPRHKLIKPLQVTPRNSLIPSGSLFSAGIVLSISEGKVNGHSLYNSAEQESLLATQVLDGAYVLNLNYTIGGRVTFYLLKPDLADLEDDLNTLSISPMSTFYLQNGVRAQSNSVTYTDPETGEEFNHGQLTITGNTTIIVMRYGATAEQETTRILNLATSRAVEAAWRNELKIVDDGRRSRYPWTSREINQLKHIGRVEGYTYKLVRPADLYPELADSPSNIEFVKL